MDLYEQIVPNYRFKVLLDHNELSFSKISGLGMSVEIENIPEGGCNLESFFNVSTGKNSKTMRMESGVCRESTSVLRKLRPGIFLPGGIIIMVMGFDGEVGMTYATESAIVTKWEIADLDGLHGELLIDTFEIAYSNLHLMD